MSERYFDYAATTPLDRRALDEMLPYLTGEYGNANSLHEMGRKASSAVQLARARVAELVGAEDPSQIFFTSGATEANNWVLKAFETAAISPFEHSSLFEPAKRRGSALLENTGLELEPCPHAVDLVSLMTVSNEIGTVFDPRSVKGIGKWLHSDITQAAGKLQPELVGGLDFASLSAHKFYGPKGVGALYSASGVMEPLLEGGEQENGARGGTLNVPGIVGMGAAAAIAQEEWEANFAKAENSRQIVLNTIEGCPDMVVNGGRRVSPYILSLSFWGIEGETLVIEMDRLGYGISSGAACSSRSLEPSHVLSALELDPGWLRGTVRISFGKDTSGTFCENLGKSLLESVQKLRTMH